MENYNEYTSLVLVIIVLVVLFIIFRSFFLWFWKVDTRVDLLSKNNILLEKIVNELKKTTSNSEDVNKNEKFELNYDEVNEQVNKMEIGQVLIQFKKTGKFLIIEKSKYELDKKLYDNHYLVYEKL